MWSRRRRERLRGTVGIGQGFGLGRIRFRVGVCEEGVLEATKLKMGDSAGSDDVQCGGAMIKQQHT